MNRGKISNHFLLYFLMLMFLVVIVGCSSSSSSSNTPPPAGTTYTVTFDSQGATVAASPTSKTVVSPATTVGTLPTEPLRQVIHLPVGGQEQTAAEQSLCQHTSYGRYYGICLLEC